MAYRSYIVEVGVTGGETFHVIGRGNTRKTAARSARASLHSLGYTTRYGDVVRPTTPPEHEAEFVDRSGAKVDPPPAR